MKPHWLFVSLALATSLVTAAELTPNDFAFGLPLELADDSALYQLAVPQEVYQHTVRSDLGDLRIFNGNGEWVPYSLATPAQQQSAGENFVRVAMFPLRGDPVQALDNFRVTIASGKGSVDLQTSSPATRPMQAQAYLIDARALDKAISALELRWPTDAPEFSGRIRIDSSDDLGQWHTLVSDAPIVHLSFAEQRLVQNRVEFTAVKAKFLRVQWLERNAAFALTEVLAQPAAAQAEPQRVSMEVTGTVVADNPNTFEFDLNAHAPVDRINVKLPQTNSFASVLVLSRDQAQAPWQSVATLNLYELRNNGQVVRNPSFTIARTTHRYWRLQAQPGALGIGAPTLQVAWVPHELTFVARGNAPFQLAFGSAMAQSATTSLSKLTTTSNTDIRVGQVKLGAVQELGGVARLQAARERPWKTWLLWASLIVAVAILALIAYRLSREMSKSAP